MLTGAGTADRVAAHVAALERSLHGPSALRRSLLREARDGLDDAAAAYRDAGIAPERAAALAVRDFGSVADVAPLLQAELAAGQGRCTALLLAVAFPALMLGWDLLLLGLRRTADPRRMAGATGLTALAAVLVSGGTAVAMNVANPADAWALLGARPLFAVAYLVSVVVLVLVGASAVRTVRAARRIEVAS